MKIRIGGLMCGAVLAVFGMQQAGAQMMMGGGGPSPADLGRDAALAAGQPGIADVAFYGGDTCVELNMGGDLHDLADISGSAAENARDRCNDIYPEISPGVVDSLITNALIALNPRETDATGSSIDFPNDFSVTSPGAGAITRRESADR